MSTSYQMADLSEKHLQHNLSQDKGNRKVRLKVLQNNTYFQISDIENIEVTGLENKIYSDKARGYKKFTQEDQIKFDAEFDRVYLNTKDTCVIHDKGFDRKIIVQKENSESTVIWTPWDKKVKTMVDMGTEDEWKKMICVESVNALENSVMVYPNESHNLIAEYLVQEY